jgi:hypothetical protein
MQTGGMKTKTIDDKIYEIRIKKAIADLRERLYWNGQYIKHDPYPADQPALKKERKQIMEDIAAFKVMLKAPRPDGND